jgi:UV DNA damage repair endonuclease
MSKLDEAKAHARFDEVVNHNILATERLIKYVSRLPINQRMVRLGSDILPLYTHAVSKSYYDNNKKWIGEKLAKIGEIIRGNDIRLDMHPGQFTIFNTTDQRILTSSIDEIEAHVDIFRWFGLTGWHTNGSMVNIHLGNAKFGAEGFIANLPLLSEDARNILSVENDEFSCGLDECLKLADHVAICLDVHHHWVNSGEYIQPDDPRIDTIIKSWRGVRPAIHYSQSPETENLPLDIKPDMAELLASGKKKNKLRSHSDYYNNTALNEWAKTFGDKFDIILESKAKNLASKQLAEVWFPKQVA